MAVRGRRYAREPRILRGMGDTSSEGNAAPAALGLFAGEVRRGNQPVLAAQCNAAQRRAQVVRHTLHLKAQGVRLDV